MARGSAQAQVRPCGNPGLDGHGGHSGGTQTHRCSAVRPALYHADEPPSRNYGPVIPGPAAWFHRFLPSRWSAQRISREVCRMQRRSLGPFVPSRVAVPRGTPRPESAAGDQRAGEARISAASSSDSRRYFAAARVTAPRLPPPAHRRSNSRQLTYERCFDRQRCGRRAILRFAAPGLASRLGIWWRTASSVSLFAPRPALLLMKG